MSKLAIIGAGGFAREAFAISEMLGFDNIGFIGEAGDKSLPAGIIGHEDDLQQLRQQYGDFSVFIAIGNTSIRSKVSLAIDAGIDQPCLIHPQASFHSDRFGKGCIIYPQAVVMPNCVLGKNCLINSGATLGHDVSLGDFCNINPGANIAGNVTIGEHTTIGIGASIRENIRIGKNVTIGAGAVVVKDVADNTTSFGNPARAQHD